MQEGSPRHRSQDLCHDIEEGSQEGDVRAHQACHSHGRVDMGATDVPHRLNQSGDGQPKCQRDLEDIGWRSRPAESRAQAKEDEEQRGQEFSKDSSGEGHRAEFPHHGCRGIRRMPTTETGSFSSSVQWLVLEECWGSMCVYIYYAYLQNSQRSSGGGGVWKCNALHSCSR